MQLMMIAIESPEKKGIEDDLEEVWNRKPTRILILNEPL